MEVYFKDKRVASHARRYDHQPSTLAEHMPSSHRAHAEWTPSRLIHWAEKSGPATGRLVAGILSSRPHPEQGYRACLGLMRLGRRYGAPRLEAACERAEHLRERAVELALHRALHHCEALRRHAVLQPRQHLDVLARQHVGARAEASSRQSGSN